MGKEIEVEFFLSTADLREAVWEWLNYHQLVKSVLLDDIKFTGQNDSVLAHVRAKSGPK